MIDSRPGFYFIVCPDVGIGLRHLADVLAKHAPESEQWEKFVFWGDESPQEEFWQYLSQGGLFGTKRALVVRRAQEWSASVWKELSAALGRKNDNVLPIFCLESPWEKGKVKLPAHLAKARCLEFAEKKGWLWKNQGITPANITKYVDAECKKLGLKFTPEAREIFCATVLPDATAIANELQKLSLAGAAGEITPKMIAIGASNPEADAFECIKLLEEGKLAPAWKEISKGAADNMVFYLVALIAREMRVLWQINNGEAPWLPRDVLNRKKEIGRRLGDAGIASGFTAALEAEWSVKSGRLSPQQALERLVAQVYALYTRPLPGHTSRNN